MDGAAHHGTIFFARSVWVEVMGRAPQGQKRPANGIERNLLVAKFATGKAKDVRDGTFVDKVWSEHTGTRAREDRFLAWERSAIAQKAANGRWR